MFTFGLYDKGTGMLTQDQLQTMVDVSSTATSGVAMLFANEWSIDGFQGKVITDPTDKSQMNGIGFLFTFTRSDVNVPGALGFHDEAGGVPYAEILLDPLIEQKAQVFEDTGVGATYLSTFQHELYESLLDLYIDDWVQMPDGRFLAKEASDPVQSVMVSISSKSHGMVYGSDAVLPRYFDAQAPSGSDFDLAGHVKQPFENLPGGYQIIFDPSKLKETSGPIVNVWGARVPEWIKCMKTRDRKDSRTQRRHARALKKLSNQFPHLAALVHA